MVNKTETIEQLLRCRNKDRGAQRNRIVKVLIRWGWGEERRRLQREISNGGATLETIIDAAQAAGIRQQVTKIIS